jgi:hypothetical protein
MRALSILVDIIFNFNLRKKIINYNRKTFDIRNNTYKKKNIVLLEINNLYSSCIGYSYVLNFLAKKYKADIFAFKISPDISIFSRLIFFVRKILLLDIFSIYASFGVKFFFFFNHVHREQVNVIFNKILKKIKNKNDVENITIDNILFGDLIYDSFLKFKKKPTIDINSNEFKFFLKNVIKIYFFWKNYFNKNNIKSLIVSHTVYLNALPLRLAISKNISCYQVTAQSIYYLNKKNIFAYRDYCNYKNIFSKFSKLDKLKFTRLAQKRINQRFQGVIGVDKPDSKKSAFGKFLPQRLIKKSNKIKVLIASHCFFDSPHSYGKNLFCDFYEWINYIGLISKRTDYDWYIKTHPDFIPETLNIIKEFTLKYNKITLLPPNSSHHQIKKEGINFVLTIYGTVGTDYSALGIPVINASVNNPHINYNFNLHPKTISEYQHTLMNLKEVRLKIDKKKVLEHYYMHNIFSNKSWIFEDYNNFIEGVGGYYKQFEIISYKYYLEYINSDKHKKIFSNLKNFITSKNYSSLTIL